LEINRVYNEDCLDTIARMPDQFIDLVVTSPPYFAGKEYEDQIMTPEGYESYLDMLLSVFIQIKRVLKYGGHLWIVIDDVHTSLKSVYKKSIVLPTHANLIFGLSKIYDYKEMVLWRKTRGKNASGGSNRLLGSYGRFRSPGSIPIVQECEYILWFKREGNRKDVTDERRKESALTPEEFKMFGMQIWDIKPERAKKIGHPTPFPIELVERIIKLSTFKYDVVYDPFFGSGTTAIACMNLNRNYIGSETLKKYCELANDRILGA
jgi:DNA modification methylase